MRRQHSGRHRLHLLSRTLLRIKRYLSYRYGPDVIAHAKNVSCSMRSLTGLSNKESSQLLSCLGRANDEAITTRRNEAGHQARYLSTKEHTSSRDLVVEFGHWEGDTIVGKGHTSCVITLIERLSKRIVTLPTRGRKAANREASLHAWLEQQTLTI